MGLAWRYIGVTIEKKRDKNLGAPMVQLGLVLGLGLQVNSRFVGERRGRGSNSVHTTAYFGFSVDTMEVQWGYYGGTMGLIWRYYGVSVEVPWG